MSKSTGVWATSQTIATAKFSDPIQPVDSRPLAFETLRPQILLRNNAGELETKHLDFDILDC